MAREAFGQERQQGGSGGNGGQQWTAEEKAAYEKQQARAFRNFAKYFAGQEDPKTRIPFKAKVIEMSDAPRPVTNRFGTRNCSQVKVELVDPPVAGIRFVMEVTDNDATERASATIMNPDSALNHLYHAATGRKPPTSGRFTWDTKDILCEEAGGTGGLVNAVIQRGNDRDDGKRGGLYSELKDFSLVIAAPSFDDDEDEAPAPAPASKKSRAKAKPAEDDDDLPF